MQHDIVILDYFLSKGTGDRNGLSILKSIVFRSAKPSTIIVSSCKSKEVKKQLHENEAKLFISKDIKVYENCVSVIKKICQNILSGKEPNNRHYKLYALLLIIILIALRLLFTVLGK